ncbi:MAG: Ig-like domain-containing protein, partial [Bacteroidales bacterium]|nr:Ig-like domain-containing protein [Bacteroidales bacterium]
MTRSIHAILLLFAGIILSASSCRKEPEQYVQLVRTRVGENMLYQDEDNTNVPFNAGITMEFNTILDTLSVPGSITLSENDGNQVAMSFSYTDEQRTIVIAPENGLEPVTSYVLIITVGLTGAAGEVFPGITYHFTTRNGVLEINAITLNDLPFPAGSTLEGISFEEIDIEITFSEPLDPVNYAGFMNLSGAVPLNYELSEDHTGVSIRSTAPVDYYKKYFFNISGNLTAASGFAFNGFSAAFHTMLDSTYKFPEITDEVLLDLVQQQTFKYFYDFAHPVSGLARERNTSGEVVTTGGSGFGLMAIVAGIERGFITRQEGIAHFTKVIGFLETADRFHGAWSHWLNGSTGDVYPFSQKDNGADLVETA